MDYFPLRSSLLGPHYRDSCFGILKGLFISGCSADWFDSKCSLVEEIEGKPLVLGS